MKQRSIKQLVLALMSMLALTVILLPTPSGAVSAGDEAAKLFQAKCAKCHGVDGSGTAMGKKLKAPDLRSDAVQKLSDDELFQAIAKGKKAFHKFGTKLSEEHIRQLVRHVRQLAKKK